MALSLNSNNLQGEENSPTGLLLGLYDYSSDVGMGKFLCLLILCVLLS